MPKKNTPETQPPLSYEAAVAELESLTEMLESGQLPLDQLLVHYQRGAELLTYCRAQLDAIEAQVKVMEGDQAKAWEREA
ncbi:exodeoxyribonuclease VII small subunit [Betaproteobacteria bacterium LSUCC0117]|nr:exodeoxyribonuclease VII small subunit [Betaproteobacteria bacterium LSUCC0117]